MDPYGSHYGMAGQRLAAITTISPMGYVYGIPGAASPPDHEVRDDTAWSKNMIVSKDFDACGPWRGTCMGEGVKTYFCIKNKKSKNNIKTH